MKFFPLVWAMLWRSKARTWLTFLSIVVAFFLFGLLSAVESAFMAGVRLAGDDRLIVTYHQGPHRALPVAYLSRIEAVEGVRAVQLLYWLGGYYQDPKNQIPTVAIDATKIRDTDPRIVVAPDQLQAFLNTRTGALAGRDLAERYGWKIGDRIPLISRQQKKDGTSNWEFELVGLLDYDEELTGYKIPANFLAVRYDFVDAAVAYPGHVLWYIVRIHDPAQATAVGRAIDKLFQNSENETKTRPEREFQMGFLRQIGDVGAIISAVLYAVFFTMILVAGNTMMQAFRERVSELGVLKTLGFTDRALALLVGTESMLLCVASAAAGLGLALLVIPPLKAAQIQTLPVFDLETATLVLGLGLAAALGALVAVIPAWKSARLTVVEALAQR